MLLRGVNAELYDGRGREILGGTEGYGILTDASGEFMDKCQVILCPVEPGFSLRDVRPSDRKEAASYYRGRRQHGWKARWSMGPWTAMSQVRVVWYTRDFDGGPPWKHEFSRLVYCAYSRNRGPLTYRLTLPRKCIITDSGFIEP